MLTVVNKTVIFWADIMQFDTWLAALSRKYTASQHKRLKFRSEYKVNSHIIQSDTKKRELLKNPIKIIEIQEKKFIMLHALQNATESHSAEYATHTG